MISSGKIQGFSLLILFYIAGATDLPAQSKTILLREFTDQQGLPNTQFRISLQDRSGIIWMGGQDGLAKYDGYTFTAFRHSNADSTSISGNNISELYEDSKGRLWIGIFGNGLNISDAAKEHFFPVEFTVQDTIDASSILAGDIVEDGLGRFWISSNVGLIVIEEHDDGFRTISLPALTGREECGPILARTLYRDVKGGIWIGSETGVFMFDPQEGRLRCPAEINGLPAKPVNMITADRMGRIWVGINGQGPRLFYSEAEPLSFTGFPCIPFESHNRGIQFTFDLDNRIWVTEFGAQFYAYDFRDSTLFLTSSINSSAPFERFVRNPFVDHSGNVWLHAAGFLIYPYPKGFENYLHPFTFHQSNTAVYGSGEYIWIGYREHGAIKLNKRTGRAKHFSSYNKNAWLPEDHIAAFLKVRSGNMIIVGYNNLTVLNAQDRVIASYPASGTNRAIFEDSGGRIWIGGFGGLFLFSETQGLLDTIRLPRDIGDSRQFIQKIVEDNEGYLWFASDLNGLGRLDPRTKEILQFLPVKGDVTSLPSSSIDDLQIDRHGMLWAATDVALVRIDPATHTITTFDKSYGFESDYICSVICDRNDKIWLSTYAGISSFDPVTLRVENYNNNDGLLNRSYYSRSSYYSDEGVIYFGGNYGVDHFHPEALRLNPTAPVMTLQGITIDNKRKIFPSDITRDQGLHLSYQNDFIEMTFAGLYYTAPQSVRYFYRMDGLGDRWIDLGPKHSAVFTDLKPGHYTFRVKAVSPDDVWSENELVLPVYVEPPFYETLWFRLLVVFLLAAALYGVIRYRDRRMQLRQKQEPELARKITQLEKRALQAQMNPHFIYNCMNSIQQFMVVHDFEGAMKYLTRFSRILRAVLNMSAQSRVSLSDELKLIEDYLELENMRFPNKFTYKINLSPELNVHTVEIPPFFIQPQVENAIRHGLLKKATQGHLVINIDREGQYVKITVEDNGIGRIASKSARQQEPGGRVSKGLAIVEERLSHMYHPNGVLPFKITDLYDAKNIPAGTRVEVYLPLD